VSGDGFIDVYVGDRRISGVIFANGVALGPFTWEDGDRNAPARLMAVVRERVAALGVDCDAVGILAGLDPR
jgi:hypothetical protein